MVWKKSSRRSPGVFNLYISHIGFFPNAKNHYRERKRGCIDNILIYCIKGKGHYIVGEKEFTVSPNQFIHLPATDEYLRYWADKEDPWSIYWVHFTGPDVRKMNESLNIQLLQGPVDIPVNNKIIEIWKNIYNSLEMGYSTDNLCNAIFCLYHLIAIFLFPDKHFKSEGPEAKDIINETIMRMRSNLRLKLTVENMAEWHNLSASHFSSQFRKSTGIPPIDYFIHLKMQKACQLLCNEDLKIKEVAFRLGYEDSYYFSRIFKKTIGSSPEVYRAKSKKGM